MKSIYDYGNFSWVLFGISIILIISIYWKWLYNIFNHHRAVEFILPTVFIVSVASFIIGMLLSLKDLTTTEQYITLTVSFVLLGIYFTILISKQKKLRYRIVFCSLFLIAFIIKLIISGIIGSWPLLLIFAQCIWGVIEPDKFNKIPLV
jgi:hypothetical protein